MRASRHLLPCPRYASEESTYLQRRTTEVDISHLLSESAFASSFVKDIADLLATTSPGGVTREQLQSSSDYLRTRCLSFSRQRCWTCWYGAKYYRRWYVRESPVSTRSVWFGESSCRLRRAAPWRGTSRESRRTKHMVKRRG